jgi:magnesium transporter
VSMGRLMSFLSLPLHVRDDRELREHVKSISRDIASLRDHSGFLATNISFLLDASLGLINIEQNAIIKIFSVAAVVSLPPTLVASIYGMNFEHMPELEWLVGYPYALTLMALSAVLPYLFFKRKGWL